MKKLFAFLALASFAVSVSAAVATPEQMTKYQERLSGAKTDFKKADIQADIDILGGADPVTFDEIVTRCKTSFTKQNYTNDKFARQKACQLACWFYSGKFAADAFKIAKADDNVFVYYLARYHSKTLGLTNEDLFDIYTSMLTGNRLYDSSLIRTTVDEIIKLAPGIAEAKAKDTLKRLNRLYSPLLIKDKATWEPVVAVIRTALDTY